MRNTRSDFNSMALFLSSSNIEKLERISTEKNLSVSEVVNQAVEQYSPHIEYLTDRDLMGLASKKLKTAIEDTQRVSSNIRKTTEQFEAKE